MAQISATLVIVELNPGSAIPPYEQLRAQIELAIVSGSLSAGHQLPPIRQLARDLEIAAGTVARAYRELESAGLIETRGRHGSVVAPVSSKPDKKRLAQQAAERFVLELRQIGITLAEANELIVDTYHRSETETPDSN